jgi:RNA polymerase sigma-70 factor (ECF subfamily)
MDVERWIRQAKAGDAVAFNHLARTFQDLLYHVALHHLGPNPDDALDVCQDALLAAWKAMPRFEGDARGFRAWLVRIVINACRDHARYARRRPTTPIEIEVDGKARELPLPHPGQTPEEYAANANLRALLEGALAQLSEAHREIVLLDQTGFNYAQIAEITGVEVGTVKSRLSRAREHLRALLGGGTADWRAAGEPTAAAGRSVDVPSQQNVEPSG